MRIPVANLANESIDDHAECHQQRSLQGIGGGDLQVDIADYANRSQCERDYPPFIAPTQLGSAEIR